MLLYDMQPNYISSQGTDLAWTGVYTPRISI